MLFKIFWVVTRRSFLVCDQRFGITCLSHVLGQTCDPETLDIHQETTTGNNPEDFKQHYDHGGSLQLHVVGFLCSGVIANRSIRMDALLFLHSKADHSSAPTPHGKNAQIFKLDIVRSRFDTAIKR
jgi:hypothetical protein